MDLDSRGQYKLVSVRLSNANFEEYRRILEALCPLGERYDHETPEMWCSRIRDPFRKILKENPAILSGNGYIIMYGKLIERSDRVHRFPTNYIYCSICDSLVFIPEKNNALSEAECYRDNHFKSCISGNSISIEYARRKDILESIDNKEFEIWQYKQFILREEAKINRLRLELFSQSTSYSEKDKLASVSYDHDSNFTASYEKYTQSKATVAKNTMPSALERYPMQRSASAPEIRNLWNDRSNCKSNTSEIFISSRYAKQNNLLPFINHFNQSNGTASIQLSASTPGFIDVDEYWTSVRKNARK